MGKKKSRKRHANRQDRRRTAGRGRALLFGLAAVVVLGAALFLASAPFRSRPAPASSAPDAQPVVVSMAGFDPAGLRARAGTDLTLRFINYDNQFHPDGGGWHQFRVEALGVDVKIAPRSQQMVTLRNLRAGSYEFYCDVCCGGKENPAMRGVLEVAG